MASLRQWEQSLAPFPNWAHGRVCNVAHDRSCEDELATRFIHDGFYVFIQRPVVAKRAREVMRPFYPAEFSSGKHTDVVFGFIFVIQKDGLHGRGKFPDSHRDLGLGTAGNQRKERGIVLHNENVESLEDLRLRQFMRRVTFIESVDE